MASADEEPLEEREKSVDESLDESKANCSHVEKALSSVQDEEERNALIFELQRQRLQYARFHMEKLALLQAMEDKPTEDISDDASGLRPKWNSASTASTSYTATAHEESTNTLPFQRGTIHRTSRCSVKIRQSSGGSCGVRNSKRRRNKNPSDSPPATDSDIENSSSVPIKLKKADGSNGIKSGDSNHAGVSDQRGMSKKHKCDTTDDPLTFFLKELPDAILQESPNCIDLPFDHSEETDITTRVDEVIVLGDGGTTNSSSDGPSANATIDRRERILNQRSAAGREIRFVHEHTWTYRLETVLQIDEDGLKKWAQRVAAERRNMADVPTNQKHWPDYSRNDAWNILHSHQIVNKEYTDDIPFQLVKRQNEELDERKRVQNTYNWQDSTNFQNYFNDEVNKYVQQFRKEKDGIQSDNDRAEINRFEAGIAENIYNEESSYVIEGGESTATELDMTSPMSPTMPLPSTLTPDNSNAEDDLATGHGRKLKYSQTLAESNSIEGQTNSSIQYVPHSAVETAESEFLTNEYELAFKTEKEPHVEDDQLAVSIPKNEGNVVKHSERTEKTDQQNLPKHAIECTEISPSKELETFPILFTNKSTTSYMVKPNYFSKTVELDDDAANIHLNESNVSVQSFGENISTHNTQELKANDLVDIPFERSKTDLPDREVAMSSTNSQNKDIPNLKLEEPPTEAKISNLSTTFESTAQATSEISNTDLTSSNVSENFNAGVEVSVKTAEEIRATSRDIDNLESHIGIEEVAIDSSDIENVDKFANENACVSETLSESEESRKYEAINATERTNTVTADSSNSIGDQDLTDLSESNTQIQSENNNAPINELHDLKPATVPTEYKPYDDRSTETAKSQSNVTSAETAADQKEIAKRIEKILDNPEIGPDDEIPEIVAALEDVLEIEEPVEDEVDTLESQAQHIYEELRFVKELQHTPCVCIMRPFRDSKSSSGDSVSNVLSASSGDGSESDLENQELNARIVSDYTTSQSLYEGNSEVVHGPSRPNAMAIYEQDRARELNEFWSLSEEHNTENNDDLYSPESPIYTRSAPLSKAVEEIMDWPMESADETDTDMLSIIEEAPEDLLQEEEDIYKQASVCNPLMLRPIREMQKIEVDETDQIEQMQQINDRAMISEISSSNEENNFNLNELQGQCEAERTEEQLTRSVERDTTITATKHQNNQIQEEQINTRSGMEPIIKELKAMFANSNAQNLTRNGRNRARTSTTRNENEDYDLGEATVQLIRPQRARRLTRSKSVPLEDMIEMLINTNEKLPEAQQLTAASNRNGRRKVSTDSEEELPRQKCRTKSLGEEVISYRYGKSVDNENDVAKESKPQKFLLSSSDENLSDESILRYSSDLSETPLTKRQIYGANYRTHRQSHQLSVKDIQELSHNVEEKQESPNVLSLARSDELLKIPLKPPRKYSENAATIKTIELMGEKRSQSLMDSSEMEVHTFREDFGKTNKFGAHMDSSEQVSWNGREGKDISSTNQFSESNQTLRQSAQKITASNNLSDQKTDFTQFYETSLGEWKEIEREAAKVLETVQNLTVVVNTQTETIFVLSYTDDLSQSPLNSAQSNSIQRHLYNVRPQKRRRLGSRRQTLEIKDIHSERSSVGDSELHELYKNEELEKEPLIIEEQVIIRLRDFSTESAETDTIVPLADQTNKHTADRNENILKGIDEVKASDINITNQTTEQNVNGRSFEQISEQNDNQRERRPSLLNQIKQILKIGSTSTTEVTNEVNVQDVNAHLQTTDFLSIQESNNQPIETNSENANEITQIKINEEARPRSLSEEIQMQFEREVNQFDESSSEEGDVQTPYWINMPDNMQTWEQVTTTLLQPTYLEVSESNIATIRKTSQISVHSLSSIIEEEEEEEHVEQDMFPSTSQSELKNDEFGAEPVSTARNKHVSFRDVTILHWLDPEPEMPHHALDISQYSTLLKKYLSMDFRTEEELSVSTRRRTIRQDASDEMSSSYSRRTTSETIDEHRIEEISKILEQTTDMHAGSMNNIPETIQIQLPNITKFPSLSSFSSESNATVVDYGDKTEEVRGTSPRDSENESKRKQDTNDEERNTELQHSDEKRENVHQEKEEMSILGFHDDFRTCQNRSETNFQFTEKLEENFGSTENEEWKNAEVRERNASLIESAKYEKYIQSFDCAEKIAEKRRQNFILTKLRPDPSMHIDRGIVTQAISVRDVCLQVGAEQVDAQLLEAINSEDKTEILSTEYATTIASYTTSSLETFKAERSIGISAVPLRAESGAQTNKPTLNPNLEYCIAPNLQRHNPFITASNVRQIFKELRDSSTQDTHLCNTHSHSAQTHIDVTDAADSTDIIQMKSVGTTTSSKMMQRFDNQFIVEQILSREEFRRIYDEILEIRRIVNTPLVGRDHTQYDAKPRTELEPKFARLLRAGSVRLMRNLATQTEEIGRRMDFQLISSASEVFASVDLSLPTQECNIESLIQLRNIEKSKLNADTAKYSDNHKFECDVRAACTLVNNNDIRIDFMHDEASCELCQRATATSFAEILLNSNGPEVPESPMLNLSEGSQVLAPTESNKEANIAAEVGHPLFAERINRLLLNVNTIGGSHTWHIPYFLVPREPELLPALHTRRSSADRIQPPKFLQAVSALLARQDQLELEMFSLNDVEQERRREMRHVRNDVPERRNVGRITKYFEEMSAFTREAESGTDRAHWRRDSIRRKVERHSDNVLPQIVTRKKNAEKQLSSMSSRSRQIKERKISATGKDPELEAAISKELGAALSQRYRHLEEIERVQASAKAQRIDQIESPIMNSKESSTTAKQSVKRPLDENRNSREEVRPPAKAPRAALRPARPSSGDDEDGEADYAALTSYYIRSASSLFRRLDRDYKNRLFNARPPLAFTVRFARPLAISLSGTRRRYHAACMPELIDALTAAAALQNGGDVNATSSIDDTMQLGAPEPEATRAWDATTLLNQLYHVDYNPLVEKRSRFRNMEGHLEVPKHEPNLIPQIENEWKKLYFRTKDGRFQWFATHFADEHPIEDILLTGSTITANRNDWTIIIKGGKENADLIVKTPSNLFEKWIQALLSHSHSSLIDAYVQPVYPPVPHYTLNIVLIELGSAAVRAGVLTNRPSLPQVFFPAVGCLLDDERAAAVGVDAFRPEVRQRGQLQSPIQASDCEKLVERYRLNTPILSACLQKVINELNVNTAKYKVLLSIPQNIPTKHASELLKTLVRQIGFKAASIARQPSLILYSYDVTTGIVVDIGERLNIVPVIDEYIVESAIISLPFGAPQIRKSLQKELASRNQRIRAFNSAIEQLLLRHIVEQACYVAVDFEEETKNPSHGPTRIDFEKFKIGGGVEPEFTVDPASAFGAPEGLFKPKRWGLEMRGIHQLIHDAIQQSPIDSRRSLYRNIYLCGGTSLLPGLCERLENELSKVAPSSIFVQVHGSPWRQHSAYLGSQVIANSFQFENCCAEARNLDEYIRQMENSA